MELDSIKRIVQTEQKAKDIVFRAQEESKRIIQNAINSEEQKRIFSKKRIDEAKQKFKNESEAKQKDVIEKITQMTEQKCELLEKQAEERMQIAVYTIFKEVIS